MYQGGVPGYPGAQPGYVDSAQQQPQFVQPMGMQQPGYPAAVGGGYDPVGGMAQQFGQLGLGGAPPVPATATQMMPQPMRAQKAQGLNQLFTVDLMQQPFNATELDHPPPEIILPPNVRLYYYCCYAWGPGADEP